MEIYKQHIPITSWAEEDRPREKLEKQGRRSLSDAELLAILINIGNLKETSVELSRRILNSQDNDLDRLGQMSLNELSKFKGIGRAKSVTIVAALELGRRRKNIGTAGAVYIRDSKSIYELMLRHFSDLPHEEFRIALMARSNKFLSHHLISTGGMTETVADPKMIFRLAIEHKATSVILMHNHPSGNSKPSKADVALTNRLCDAGRLLDIAVVDHLIFVNSGFFSFADEGLI